MMYSEKVKLNRRNSIMAAVKKELKANNAFISPEHLRAIAAKIDTSTFYAIEVLRDAEKAAYRLRLANHETTYFWPSTKGWKEEAQIVFGSVTFGEDGFSDWDLHEPADEWRRDGEFNINEPFAMILRSREWCDPGMDSNAFSEKKEFIVIYVPESIIDEGKYVTQKDAELERLCTLR